MYRSIQVENFRCFEKLRLNRLGRVNLVTGRNNVGKTALLEAIFLQSGHGGPHVLFRLAEMRSGLGWDATVRPGEEPPWRFFFRDYSGTFPVVLQAEWGKDKGAPERRRLVFEEVTDLSLDSSFTEVTRLSQTSSPTSASVVSWPGEPWSVDSPARGHVGDNGGQTGRQGPDGLVSTGVMVPHLKRTLELGSYSEQVYFVVGPNGMQVPLLRKQPDHLAVFFHSGGATRLGRELVEVFGQVVRRKEGDLVLRALRSIEPRLRDVQTVVVQGRGVLHGDIGLDRLVPLHDMGQGMVRLAALLLGMLKARGGVLLVDEIENGIHHSSLVDVWGYLGRFARDLDVQVFGTTHSLECVRAGVEAFRAHGMPELKLYRLEQGPNGVQAVSYDRESLEAAAELDLEVR